MCTTLDARARGHRAPSGSTVGTYSPIHVCVLPFEAIDEYDYGLDTILDSEQSALSASYSSGKVHNSVAHFDFLYQYLLL